MEETKSLSHLQIYGRSRDVGQLVYRRGQPIPSPAFKHFLVSQCTIHTTLVSTGGHTLRRLAIHAVHHIHPQSPSLPREFVPISKYHLTSTPRIQQTQLAPRRKNQLIDSHNQVPLQGYATVFRKDPVFGAKSGPETDAAWKPLMHKGLSQLEIANPQAYNLEPGIPTSIEGVETFYVGIFHQLHCLVSQSPLLLSTKETCPDAVLSARQ